MSERITRVTMAAFRGVPETFDLELARGMSLVAFGDNATGKSTLADAVEWYFTNQIDHLAKEGRASAIRHAGASGDHTTYVTIETTGQLGGTVTQSQAPPSAAMRAGSRETFLLRGRTLANFIEKTKGEKWKALAEILGLDDVEAFRADLQRARNQLRTHRADSKEILDSAKEALREHVDDLSVEAVLSHAQELARDAMVTEPDSFDQTLDTTWRQSLTPRQDDIAYRAAAIGALATSLRSLSGVSVDLSAATTWNQYVSTTERSFRPRLQLFESAREILDAPSPAGRCPLCDQEVDASVLENRIATMLEELREAADSLTAEREAAGSLVRRLKRAHESRADIRDRAREQDVPLPDLPAAPVAILEESLGQVEAFDLDGITAYSRELETWDRAAAEIFDGAAPHPGTAHGQALVRLVELSVAASQWKQQEQAYNRAARVAERAEKVFEAYAEEQRLYFEEVLERISKRVAEIYRELHPGEGLGGIGIGAWGNKGVELSVEFHGRQHRPPHGVLSESHLNSLGIALFPLCVRLR